MNEIITQAKNLADPQLPAHENMLLVANELGLKPEPDESNSEKIGRSLTIDGRRFFGKGRSEEEALGQLFEKIIAAAPSAS